MYKNIHFPQFQLKYHQRPLKLKTVNKYHERPQNLKIRPKYQEGIKKIKIKFLATSKKIINF